MRVALVILWFVMKLAILKDKYPHNHGEFSSHLKQDTQNALD